jgi:L-lactate dehydrogenase complex protein LldG
MSAREEILTKVRQRLPVASELPRLDNRWTTYPDPATRFEEVLASVGGRCVRVAGLDELNRELAAIPEYVEAARRVSVVEGVGESTFDLGAVEDPHALEDVDFAVLPGELAVAENAAVWTATDDLNLRTLYFLAQHLAIVVPADRVVSNLHESYEQIDVSARRFGTFVSGPSKTADIEQSLVIGAHGARTLTVFFLQKP